MLLIIINYIFILYVSYLHGFLVCKFANPWQNHSEGLSYLALILITGLAVISFFLSLLLFFVPINLTVTVFIFCCAIIIHLVHCKAVHSQWKKVLSPITISELIVMGLITIPIVHLSSQPSQINDDGLYYIQTIKWFNEVGYVNGISNLHVALGLGSTWHMLHSLCSFHFVADFMFNDLNGFLLIVYFIYTFGQRNEGYLPLVTFTISLFVIIPFLTAPSPDVPIIILTLLTFHEYLNKGTNRSTGLAIIILFAFTIKLSGAPLILIAICIVIENLKRKDGVGVRTQFTLIIAVPILIAVKNIYQTGYPLYPYHFLNVFHFDYETPRALMAAYTDGIKTWGISNELSRDKIEQLSKVGLLQTLKMLVGMKGIKGVVNVGILALIIGVVASSIRDAYGYTQGKRNVYRLTTIHLVSFLSFIAWLYLAPQIRFILPFLIFYASLIIVGIIHKLPAKVQGRMIRLFPATLLIIIFIISVLPINLNQNRIYKPETLQSRYFFIKPHFSYNLQRIDTILINSNRYFHPNRNPYCWNCPLPCLSRAYQSRLLTSNGLSLKRRGKRLKDGFEVVNVP